MAEHARSGDIDPRLLVFAEECVCDLVSEVGRAAVPDHSAVVDRLAKAMQQACEQEYAALVEELTAMTLSPRVRAEARP